MDIYLFTEENSDKEAAAGDKKGEQQSGTKTPIGIYPVATAIVAAYLVVKTGKSRRRKI
jgi:TolB protein